MCLWHAGRERGKIPLSHFSNCEFLIFAILESLQKNMVCGLRTGKFESLKVLKLEHLKTQRQSTRSFQTFRIVFMLECGVHFGMCLNLYLFRMILDPC